MSGQSRALGVLSKRKGSQIKGDVWNPDQTHTW